MPYSLILQYPYETIEIALCKNGEIISFDTLHKFNATSQTIPTIINLLAKQNLKLSDISFFGANVGPGPYNTLRAILTMLNGIHRVNQIPIITKNGLDLLSSEIKTENSLVLFNAFENHVFFQIKTTSTKKTGSCSLLELKKIVSQESKPLAVFGNGAIKYKEELKTWPNIEFSEKIITFNSLEFLGASTFETFKNNTFNLQYAKPIYFEDLLISSYK